MSRASIVAIVILLTVLAAGATAAPGPGTDSDAPDPAPAGIRVPATPPAADPETEHAFGYRDANDIARDYGYDPAATGRHKQRAGTAATVVVSAFVAPVRTIVLDEGTVTTIISNTDRTGAGEALYVAREGSESGPAVTIDASNWPAIRAALAKSASGTGVIYPA